MDGKLAAMAKSTVFARCGQRDLVVLGRLMEMSRLASGAELPGPEGRWRHVVLDGLAIALVDGTPVGIMGEGATWSGTGRDTSGLRSDRRAVALTDVTLLSVAARSLGAVALRAPEVAARFTHTDVAAVAAVASVASEGEAARHDAGRPDGRRAVRACGGGYAYGTEHVPDRAEAASRG